MLVMPCMRDTDNLVCQTFSGTCPDTGLTDAALRGAKTTDKTVILGGDPAAMYTIVLHVQGEVESKNYQGGTDQATTLADGWRVGGTPATNNAYAVYMLRVTAPGATTSTDYFLNSLDPPGVENHTTYGIDYMTAASGATALTVRGGSTVRLVAADSNCAMTKNCGPNGSSDSCLGPIILPNVEQTAVTSNPSFNFSTAYNGQWIVLTVKSVTQN